jgi:hypothetical protein
LCIQSEVEGDDDRGEEGEEEEEDHDNEKGSTKKSVQLKAA